MPRFTREAKNLIFSTIGGHAGYQDACQRLTERLTVEERKNSNQIHACNFFCTSQDMWIRRADTQPYSAQNNHRLNVPTIGVTNPDTHC